MAEAERNSAVIVSADVRWRDRIEAALAGKLDLAAEGGVRWCPNVYEALAEAVLLKKQGRAGIVCVMVDYLSGREMGVFTQLRGMANIKKVMACSASTKGGKLEQAQALGADEGWVLARELPKPIAAEEQTPIKEVAQDSPAEVVEPEAEKAAPVEGGVAKRPQESEVKVSRENLLSKEELDALLG